MVTRFIIYLHYVYYNFQIKVHHTMVSVYDMIDKCHLPTEYLPDDYTGPSAGSIADIAGRFLSYTNILLEQENGVSHVFS